MTTPIDGHPGQQAVAAMMAAGTTTMFTLNGAHIWPLYEGARDQGMAVVDTRHEQTAAFAAEAWAKLTRTPGFAALTAGPGITNAVSAITSARFNGAPLVAIGGRSAQASWGAGALQELDHVPLVAPVTKSAGTITDPAAAAREVHAAAVTAMSAHRGPVFLDVPADVFFTPASGELPAWRVPTIEPDPDRVAVIADLLHAAERPAFVVGSDLYWERAEGDLRVLVDELSIPCFFNGLGRGTLPADHDLAFMRTRGVLKQRADLVVVIGTPLDFRLGFGKFGAAQVAHVVDSPGQQATHIDVPTAAGDIGAILRLLANGTGGPDRAGWIAELRRAEDAARQADESLLGDDAAPIRPARIYQEVTRRLARDAVVICDGGDFASYAGKFVEVYEPGCWLDTGPYGCLGNGMGYAAAARLARPSSQVVAMLGDGALGFGLADVDTLVRHRLPAVLVVGNNGIWGLEKHPMQAVYGWDMACDLQPETRYDEVVIALGGGGETVRRPAELGPAIERALASDLPYLLNVITDPTDAYPRTSSLG
jgi:acetolactate synthase I/II/III large subunit